MNEPSYFYNDMTADYYGIQPSEIKGSCNREVEVNKRYLYNKIYSLFDIKLPKEWPLNYFRAFLFQSGSIGALYTKAYDWIMSPYSVTRLDIYNQPAVIQSANNKLKDVKTGVIGLNAEIIKIFDDYRGLNDIVTRYAEKLAQIDRSINVNLMNSNVTAAFGASSKKEAEEIKEAYEQATEGKPLVVMNKDLIKNDGKGLTVLFPVGSNYIVDKLQTARRMVLNEFLTEIGIRNANYDKKERLVSAEVEENNDETSAIVTVMYNNLNESFKRLNAVAGKRLCSVKLHYNYVRREDKTENE